MIDKFLNIRFEQIVRTKPLSVSVFRFFALFEMTITQELSFITTFAKDSFSVTIFFLILTVDVSMVAAKNLTLPHVCKFDDTLVNFTSSMVTYQPCCDLVVDSVYTDWTINDNSLSIFLEILKSRNCSQFEHECRRRTFGFTNFTELVYLRYCNSTEMERRCIDEIQNIVERRTDTLFPSWKILLDNLDPVSSSSDELLQPCVQIAMLDQFPSSRGNFFELTAIPPFCEVVWCGFDKSVLLTRDFSVWKCIPSE